MVACPRNHQDPTAVSIGGGGIILLGEGEDLRQGTDQDDVGLAAFFAGMYFDVLDHGADQLHGLRSGSLIRQEGLQLSDLFVVQVRHVGVEFDALLFVNGVDRPLQIALADFQVAQLVAYQAGIAVALGDEGQASFDGGADLVKVLLHLPLARSSLFMQAGNLGLELDDKRLDRLCQTNWASAG